MFQRNFLSYHIKTGKILELKYNCNSTLLRRQRPWEHSSLVHQENLRIYCHHSRVLVIGEMRSKICFLTCSNGFTGHVFNPFLANVPFLYLQKTQENIGVFKGYIGQKWVGSFIHRATGLLKAAIVSSNLNLVHPHHTHIVFSNVTCYSSKE